MSKFRFRIPDGNDVAPKEWLGIWANLYPSEDYAEYEELIAKYKSFSREDIPNVRVWTDDWARRNRCTGDPVEARVAANVDRLTYANCAENADVVLYTIKGGGHTWPGGKGTT